MNDDVCFLKTIVRGKLMADLFYEIKDGMLNGFVIQMEDHSPPLTRDDLDDLLVLMLQLTDRMAQKITG